MPEAVSFWPQNSKRELISRIHHFLVHSTSAPGILTLISAGSSYRREYFVPYPQQKAVMLGQMESLWHREQNGYLKCLLAYQERCLLKPNRPRSAVGSPLFLMAGPLEGCVSCSSGSQTPSFFILFFFFYKELPRASEMSPSRPAVGSALVCCPQQYIMCTLPCQSFLQLCFQPQLQYPLVILIPTFSETEQGFVV